MNTKLFQNTLNRSHVSNKIQDNTPVISWASHKMNNERWFFKCKMRFSTREENMQIFFSRLNHPWNMCPISLCNFPPLALQVAFSLFPDATVFFCRTPDLPGSSRTDKYWTNMDRLFIWFFGFCCCCCFHPA